MRASDAADAPTRRQVFTRAWPIILANAAVPLLGLADTAVIGHTGSAEDLGAIALGALVFSFVYWGFGFLRMGTTGFTAQAAGAGDEAEVRATLARGLGLGVGIGAVLVALQSLVGWVAFELLSGSDAVESIALGYFRVRIWGAPAALGTFALMGLLIGLGRSGHLLVVQLVLNGVNILLDVLFAGVFGWGAEGIALGTAVAEWCSFGLALLLCVLLLRERHTDDEPFWPAARLRDLARLRQTIGANADIMIRTLFLLFGFAWFTNQGARFGDVLLAANHVLLQLVSFAAFFLDGYAFVAESLVGSAVGARRLRVFDAAVRRSTELAGFTAVALALVLLLLGPLVVNLLTDLPAVGAASERYLPFAAIYVLCSFPAFQLDGIFIGATRTRDLRNASILSLAVFLVAWWLLAPSLGNTGLWLAFIVFVIARGLALGARYGALRASVQVEEPARGNLSP